MNLLKSIFSMVFICFIFTFTGFSQNEDIKNKITNIQMKFVPDKRIGIFNIQSKKKNDKIILNGETDSKSGLDTLILELKKDKSLKVESNVILLPESALGDKTFGLITISVANMRKEPDHDYELISQTIMGTEVKILKKKNGFYLCQTPDKYLGWIESGSLKIGNSELKNEWRNAKKVIFLDQFGWVYSKPDEDSDPVCDYVINSVIYFEGKENGWVKVRNLRNETGYVKEKSVIDLDEWTKTRSATPEKIIKDAHKFMGIPYLWGGYSAKALDCSGFTKTVFWMNGILLPRDANQQAFIGEEINPGNNFENVKPGDLLFFGSKRDGKPRVTHVAIYLGEKKFIHCSFYVRINSFEKDSELFDPSHSDHLLKVSRIIK